MLRNAEKMADLENETKKQFHELYATIEAKTAELANHLEIEKQK